jgi:hypothetical protein
MALHAAPLTGEARLTLEAGALEPLASPAETAIAKLAGSARSGDGASSGTNRARA